MSEKRELVLKAFRGESVDRVPVGFWHHFTTEDEWLHGFENPEIIDKNKAGHKKFIEEVKPDFVKLMSDVSSHTHNLLLKILSQSVICKRLNL